LINKALPWKAPKADDFRAYSPQYESPYLLNP